MSLDGLMARASSERDADCLVGVKPTQGYGQVERFAGWSIKAYWREMWPRTVSLVKTRLWTQEKEDDRSRGPQRKGLLLWQNEGEGATLLC